MGKALIGGGACAQEAKRKHWPIELKRRIVEASLAAGASVSQVSRAYDVNANQVFLWRRLYRSGLLQSADGNAKLVSVRITNDDPATATCNPASARRTRPTGIIQVEMERGRLRIEGTPDPLALRLVLEQLRG
jgi:transposase